MLWLHLPKGRKKREQQGITLHIPIWTFPLLGGDGQSQEAHICFSHLHCHAAVSPVMAARREGFTLHLLPKPTFTILHFPTCRQIIFKARKYFLLDAMNQLPCLPAPEKCPSVSGNKRQLHQTAQVFSMYSQGCHLPWLLQCGPRWFYNMTGGRERGVKELTHFHSPTVGGRIQAAASAAWYVDHIQQFPAHAPDWSASYRLSQF